jgi:cytochrome c oxidase subunit 3
LSYSRLKRDKILEFKLLFLISALLGIIFLIGQVIGWGQLRNSGVYVSTNPSSSFFYLLTWLHGLHLFGGVISMIYVLIKALKGFYNSRNRLGVELCATYWHFLDFLWIYLFIFIKLTI